MALGTELFTCETLVRDSIVLLISTRDTLSRFVVSSGLLTPIFWLQEVTIINCLFGALKALLPFASSVSTQLQSKESLGVPITTEYWPAEEDLPTKPSSFGTPLITL